MADRWPKATLGLLKMEHVPQLQCIGNKQYGLVCSAVGVILVVDVVVVGNLWRRLVVEAETPC